MICYTSLDASKTNTRPLRLIRFRRRRKTLSQCFQHHGTNGVLLPYYCTCAQRFKHLSSVTAPHFMRNGTRALQRRLHSYRSSTAQHMTYLFFSRSTPLIHTCAEHCRRACATLFVLLACIRAKNLFLESFFGFIFQKEQQMLHDSWIIELCLPAWDNVS